MFLLSKSLEPSLIPRSVRTFPLKHISQLLVGSLEASCLFLVSLLRNWCAYVVRRNVSCAVQGSVESFQEPIVAPCPAYQPDCQQQVTWASGEQGEGGWGCIMFRCMSSDTKCSSKGETWRQIHSQWLRKLHWQNQKYIISRLVHWKGKGLNMKCSPDLMKRRTSYSWKPIQMVTYLKWPSEWQASVNN